MKGGSDGASYCEPPKIHEPETWLPKNTWHQNFLLKKNTILNTSILIYSIKQTSRPKKTDVTNLSTQKKYREGKFSTQLKYVGPSCHIYYQYPHPPWAEMVYCEGLMCQQTKLNKLNQSLPRVEEILFAFQLTVNLRKQLMVKGRIVTISWLWNDLTYLKTFPYSETLGLLARQDAYNCRFVKGR